MHGTDLNPAVTSGLGWYYLLAAVPNGAGRGVAGGSAGRARAAHPPAVGLGKPIDRTLWALVWAVSAVIFQAMGIVYIFNQEFGLPLFIRDAIDYVSGPTTFFLDA